MKKLACILCLFFGSVAVSYGHVLDDVSGAYAAYGLRKLNSTYSGYCIKVRRASDNTTQDIGFSGDRLDVSALETFCLGTDGYIDTWYDQSGNGNDITQTITGSQPQIVDNGSAIVDFNGLPYIRFLNGSTELNGALGTAISNQNMTVFSMVANTDSPIESRFFQLSNCSFFRIESVSIFDGSSWLSSGTVAIHPWEKNIALRTHDFNGVDYKGYIDGVLSKEFTFASYTAQTSTSLSVGYWLSGKMQELIIYPHLSDADISTASSDVSNYYNLFVATNKNTTGGLPQNFSWEVGLYDWLETLTIADFDVTSANLSWDETYTDTEELSNIWLNIANDANYCLADGVTSIYRNESYWYVLDDGASHGIEGSGTVKIMHTSSGNYETLANYAGYIYTLDLPLAGSGQGNPYYHNKSVALRAAVTDAADMMMFEDYMAGLSYNVHADYYIGGKLLGFVTDYYAIKDELSAETQSLFEDAFQFYAKRLYAQCATGELAQYFGNMQAKAIHALAYLYAKSPRQVTKNICLAALKKELFGKEDGGPDDINGTYGVYDPAGFFREGSGADPSYNGHSLYHIAGAASVTYGDADTAFLQTILNRMAEWKVYQFYDDPSDFWKSPATYANRTAYGVINDQGGAARESRELTFASYTDYGRPLVNQKDSGTTLIKSTADMVSEINTAISYANAENIGLSSTATPTDWNLNLSHIHWTLPRILQPKTGWYTDLKALIDNNDESVKYPIERDTTWRKSFSGKFMSVKGYDGSRYFGYWLETQPGSLEWTGWNCGYLDLFWIEDTGVLVAGAHNKTGSDLPYENTGIWYAIQNWAGFHVWGVDDVANGGRFSTMKTGKDTHEVNYNGTSVIQEVTTIGDGHGEETGNEITGTMETTLTFKPINTGLQITYDINYTGSDKISELWCTVPIFRRDSDQDASTATTIDYWDGASWNPLTTAMVSTTKIRLGRDFGSGAHYGYIVFAKTQSVRLSDTATSVCVGASDPYSCCTGSGAGCQDDWVQEYQDNGIYRNIDIDLLGSQGIDVNFPSTTITMQISTQESWSMENNRAAFSGNITMH